MKKKVMCMLLTGMMAASMIAGCGNSGNASANAGADTKQVNVFAALYDSEHRLAAVKAAGNAISGNDTLNMSMTFDGITDLTGYSLKTLVWDGSNVPYIEAVPIEY